MSRTMMSLTTMLNVEQVECAAVGAAVRAAAGRQRRVQCAAAAVGHAAVAGRRAERAGHGAPGLAAGRAEAEPAGVEGAMRWSLTAQVCRWSYRS